MSVSLERRVNYLPRSLVHEHRIKIKIGKKRRQGMKEKKEFEIALIPSRPDFYILTPEKKDE